MRHRAPAVCFNRPMATTTAPRFTRSLLPGSYVSTDDRYTAELRPAGYYAEFGCNLTRHYAIRLRGGRDVIGTVRTLAEATRVYL